MERRKKGYDLRFVGIDPSTKTGFVAIGADGSVLKAKELSGISDKDPKRMVTLINEVIEHIQKDDFIVIEGFGYASQQAIQLGGIGWGIRMSLFGRGMKYYEVSPNAVKKFVGVSGWTGEKGNKKRLTGPQKKKAVKTAVIKHYNFTHSSDNIVDAYIMAHIAKSIWKALNGYDDNIAKYQKEVIKNILQNT